MRSKLIINKIEEKLNDYELFAQVTKVLDRNREELGKVDMEAKEVLELPVITCFSSPSTGYDYAVLAGFHYGFDEIQAASDWCLITIAISSRDIRPQFENYSELLEFHESIEEDEKLGFLRDNECENINLGAVIEKITEYKSVLNAISEQELYHNTSAETNDDLELYFDDNSDDGDTNFDFLDEFIK